MNINEQLLNFRPPRIAMLFVVSAFVINLLISIPVLPALPITAAIAGITGLAIMLRAWRLFKLKETAICPTAKATSLVRYDVYSVTRNPMYLGIILMLTGLALYAGTLPFYVVALIYFLVINNIFCPHEERVLEEIFGDDYRVYRTNVRRWL